MLCIIPKTKYYKNNVSPKEYDQLLSALAGVKERYILLKARELIQLSVKVAMFWQIFHPSPRPGSRALWGSTQWICHMQDVHKRKTLPVWLPHALGFARQPSEAPTAMNVSVHQHAREKTSLQSLKVHIALRWPPPGEYEEPSCGLGKQCLCLRRLPKNASTTHLQKLPEKWSSDMNIYTHANTQQSRAEPWRRGMAGLHVIADEPASAAQPQPGGKCPISGNSLSQHVVK